MQLGRQASRVERGAHVECLSGVLRVDHWLWLATEPYKVLQRTDWTRICQSGPYAFMALRPECQPVVFVSPSCTQPSFPCLIRLVASYQRHVCTTAAEAVYSRQSMYTADARSAWRWRHASIAAPPKHSSDSPFRWMAAGREWAVRLPSSAFWCRSRPVQYV